MGNAPAKLFGVALVSSLPQFNLYRDSRFQVQAIFELDIGGFVIGKLARPLAQLLSGGHRLAANGRLRVDNSLPGG